VHYQPILDLETLGPVGAEALIRWPRRDAGWVPPTLIIDIAEHGGIIHDLGPWVLRRACADASEWVDLLPGGCPVSVNLSGCQLADPTLVSLVRTALNRAGLAPELLMLEVTETAYPDDLAVAAAALNELHSFGVGVAVDDFGTGFSSFDYLRAFPVDSLKIDRSYVDGIGRVPVDQALLAGVLALADRVGMATVAEGIETPTQLAVLRELGVTRGQGFLLARPMPAPRFAHWLESRARRTRWV
jgi:EAL domain-containing protein (putative c-di-GMP-specific phosphodiesterase class I)